MATGSLKGLCHGAEKQTEGEGGPDWPHPWEYTEEAGKSETTGGDITLIQGPVGL